MMVVTIGWIVEALLSASGLPEGSMLRNLAMIVIGFPVAQFVVMFMLMIKSYNRWW